MYRKSKADKNNHITIEEATTLNPTSYSTTLKDSAKVSIMPNEKTIKATLTIDNFAPLEVK
ncbi:hypothetical protein CGI97_24160, partial [Vibrio parahaemolyticus]|uniref:hypothetical protein n=1 Tax=Vibrio parahaemolyticus TaxID=670 RepID=UPI001169CA19